MSDIPDRHFGDDIIGSLDNWGEKTLAPVCIIMGHHASICQTNRDKFKENDIKLTQAHASACSSLMNLLSRSAGRQFTNTSENLTYQVDLVSHFTQGINICEVAIVEGLHIQAATLLRQEHEMIAAIQELGLGRRKDGKTPHATVGVLKDMGRAYGDLSGAAHASQARLLHDIISIERGEQRSSSMFPLYHRELSRNLYSLHVCYIVFMARIAGAVHEALGLGGLSDDETRLLTIAISILMEEGLVVQVDAPLEQPFADIRRTEGDA